MALLKTGSYKNTGTVYLDYKLYSEQISGSGNTRTIRVTVEFKCGGNPSYPSWYGYPCYWQPYVNSTYGSTGTIKGSETWNTNNGYRSFSQTITVNVGTTSSTNVTVGFVTNSEPDNGWDGGASASFGVSSTNTPPTLSGSVTADGTTQNKYINENQGSITLSWPAASDANGNLAGYRIRVSINGGGYSEIGRTNASTRTFTHNIAGYGAGTSFRYALDSFDYESAWSAGSILSGVITKNTMTKATLASIPSIVYNTEAIKIDWSGATNQVSDRTFQYSLSCNGVTIHRGDTTANTLTIAIVDSAPSTGPYILKSDLVNFVRNSSYKGTLNFTLKTTNKYGSSASDSKSCSVNLQSPPATPRPVINTTDDITDALNIWRTAADTKSRYMIPNGTRRIRVSWQAVSGLYGETISYDVFYKIGSGGYIALGNQSETYYNLVLPTQEKMAMITFMVRAKSSYGLVSNDGVSLGQNLHYYRAPYIIFGKLTRTDTTATLQVRVLSESSIPNINTKGTYRNTTSGSAAVSLPLNQADLSTLNFSGLSSKASYDITFVYNDSTGFTPDNSTVVFKIGPNLSSFFVNKYGIGVGGFKATADAVLNVNGNGFIKGLMSVEGNVNVTSVLSAGNIISSGGVITSSSPKGGDAAIVLDRGAAANWRFLDSAGILKIQTDWDNSKGAYHDIMTLNPNNGNIALAKGDLLNKNAMSIDGFTNATILNNGTDLNNIKTPGCYRQTANANTTNNINMPYPGAFFMEVIAIGTDLIVQRFTTYGGELIAVRAFYGWNNTWEKWQLYKSRQYKKQEIPATWGFTSPTQFHIGLKSEDFQKGCWLITMEYNHHTGGSSAYWSTEVFIAANSTLYRNGRLEDVISITKLHTSGRSIIPRWDSTGSDGKPYNSSSPGLKFIFDQPADNHNASEKIRAINVRRLVEM